MSLFTTFAYYEHLLKMDNNLAIQTYRLSLDLFYGMGNDVTEVTGALLSPWNIKVHRFMCTKLIDLIERITRIFPEIEASRPRCSSGIQALCSLRNGIEKAKSLLQHCCEDSKLYLAIKGEATLLRCKNTRNLLEQSLSYIQSNVPVILAAEISPIISDLRGAMFSLDTVEEEAGKAMRIFLRNYAASSDSMDNTAVETLRFAFLSLNITSQRALLTERRSIKRLLENVGDAEGSKKNVLHYLMVLLKKHGKSVVDELSANFGIDSFHQSNSYELSTKMETHFEYGPNSLKNDNMSGRVVLLPPEEYKCPLSCKLMYDPVIISSGVTFERIWVEKWLNEGHDTCPKTKTKLNNLSLTPNRAMKELISEWCILNEVSVPEPLLKSTETQSWDSSLTSISSLNNLMDDLNLPMDFSQLSFASLDSNSSVLLRVKDGFRLGINKTEDESHRFLNYQKKFVDFEKLNELSWECQCELVEAMMEQLIDNDEGFYSVCAENFVGPLVRFLKQSLGDCEGNAQKTGTRLLLVFVTKGGSSIPSLPEEIYGLLISLLDSQATSEALAMLELLSYHICCRSQMVGSGVLDPMLGILETKTREFLEPTIRIINNLSLSSEICSFVAPSEFIPKLVPLFEDDSLARYGISILKNLCGNETTRTAVAETRGCIPSIAKLLDTGTDEVKEHGVIVLLSLCCQRVQYCRMVMEEGVIPPLHFISQTGTEKGKASAFELLRQLRSVNLDNTQVSSETDHDSSSDSFDHLEVKKPPSKGSRKSGIKLPIFLKQSSSSSKTKK